MGGRRSVPADRMGREPSPVSDEVWQTATRASDRYGTSLAPSGLRLVQELANSIARLPAGDDLLADPGVAEGWLAAVAAGWCAEHGEAVPGLQLSAAATERLRALRTGIRALLGGTAEPQSPVLWSSPVTVDVRPHRVSASPSGSGAQWVESAVSAELLMAQGGDLLHRLKLCASASCTVAFYDRSRNNSRVWHDLKACGAPSNVRAYRQRLRDQSSADAAPGAPVTCPPTT